ncbi:MAG: NUDIX hydrolase [Ktedonobacteraceae bacterium]
MNSTRTMITFNQGDTKFTYRVGGIIIQRGYALFQRATLNPEHIFWFLPGGRAEVGESAGETLEREMLEEVGEEVQVDTLLYIVENFFTDVRKHHELGLYFSMQLPPDSTLLQQADTIVREEVGMELPIIFDWLPLTQLPELDIRPGFFKYALQELPQQPVHVLIKDGKYSKHGHL